MFTKSVFPFLFLFLFFFYGEHKLFLKTVIHETEPYYFPMFLFLF